MIGELLTGAAVLFMPVVFFSGLYFVAARKAVAPSDKPKPEALPSPNQFSTITAASDPPTKIAPDAVAPPAPVAKAEQGPQCEPADPKLAVAIVNRDDVDVFAGPHSFPIEGWDGKPLKLDPRFEFQVLDRAGEWVRIKIMPPKWPPDRGERTGWIRRQFIQRVESVDEKQCLFVNFADWSGLSPSARNSMREFALKILREDRRCSRISEGGYLGQGQRFYFSCYPTDGGRPYHYWFSATDSISDQNFAGHSSALGQQAAIVRCRAALDDAVARRAKINRIMSSDVQVDSTSASTLNGAQFVTFTLMRGVPGQDAKVAYCFSLPGGDPEITLR